MKKIIRRITLLFLASLPITSIAFAAKKALQVGELKGFDDLESTAAYSESHGS